MYIIEFTAVSKKDQNEKQTKSQKESNSSQNVADSGTPIKTSEKEREFILFFVFFIFYSMKSICSLFFSKIGS